MTRQMGDFKVQQRTKDGMFNATELLKQWNEFSGMKKEIIDYFFNASTKELIEVMNNDDDFLNRGNYPYLKQRGKYNGGTWMHPLLFIDFAMWLNPKFKLQVLKFVQDKLIELRHDAGDEYKRMADALDSIKGGYDIKYMISKVSMAINFIVFRRHSIELRNNATTKQLKQITELEQFIYNSIELGIINDFDTLITMLRNKYRKMHEPGCFKKVA